MRAELRLNKKLTVGHSGDSRFTEESSLDTDVTYKRVHFVQGLAGTLRDRLTRTSSRRALSLVDDAYDWMGTFAEAPLFQRSHPFCRCSEIGIQSLLLFL